MNSSNQGRTPVYDTALKVAVSVEYLTSNLSKRELGKKYGLSAKTVDGFVSWYRKRHVTKAEDTVDTSVADNLNAKQLSQQLKEANLKIAGLEMLIEVARKELGIDIIKKPGTKQSLK
jgi:transposase